MPLKVQSNLKAYSIAGITGQHINGILEDLNSVIQAAKRKARGYKVKHFKTIAYFLTGKLDFSKVNANCLPT